MAPKNKIPPILDLPYSGKPKISAVVVSAFLLSLGFALIAVWLVRPDLFKRPISSIPITKENTVVSRVEVAAARSLRENLPSGFPSEVPVENGGIIESYSVVYTERNLTQFTVTYDSSKKVNEKYEDYLKFMNSNGFAITSNKFLDGNGYLYGNKNNNDLSVNIRSENGRTKVYITYIDRN